MIREIVTSPLMLKRPSEPATRADEPVAADLLDTIEAHRAECVGMAANMIGRPRRIIVTANGRGGWLLMYNPQVIEARGPYQAEEGCLSLPGLRTVTRYRRIRVSYEDAGFVPRTRAFSGELAQIIQHEVDPCDGVLV